MTGGRGKGFERLALSAFFALSICVGWQEMVNATSKVNKDTKSGVAAGKSGAAAGKSGAAAGKAILNAKELSSLTQVSTALGAGLVFHEMTLPSGTRAYAVVIDTKNGAWKIAPSINKPITTTTKSAQVNSAVAAINGGYFNMSDGDSVSFVTIDGKQVCDPKTNKALVENEKLKPFLPQIFNREEFRVYADKKGKRSYAIEKHDAPIPTESRLVHVLQGGPMLLPKYTAREGAFVRTDASGVESDSIGTTKPAARTAIGITTDAIVLLIVEGRRTKEFSTGASLTELADFFTKIGCNQALNFDGGTSTTLVVKLPSPQDSDQNGGSPAAGTSDDVQKGLTPDETSSNAADGRGVQADTGSSPSVLKTIFSSSPERRVKSVLIVTPSK